MLRTIRRVLTERHEAVLHMLEVCPVNTYETVAAEAHPRAMCSVCLSVSVL